MGGEVVAINEELEDTPELVNEDAFGKGWMVRIKPANPEEWDTLLDAAGYQEAVEAEESH